MEKSGIILINPPSDSIRKPEEHLGLGYLAAVLRSAGFTTQIIDAYLGTLSISKTLKLIKENEAVKIIGISPTIDSYVQTEALIKKIKEYFPSVTIVLGGHLATFSFEDILTKLPVDFIVRGEGEMTFLELAKAICEGNTDFSKINGIAFLNDGGVIKTEPRELIGNLDELPFPERDTIQEAINKKSISAYFWK